MGLSDLEKKVAEVFVTSADDPIYAIKSNVPPEMFGAFGSYFSRNPKDFRAHLIDAIKGQIEEEETEVSDRDLLWLADRDFREPFDAIRKGISKSQAFFKKWYGKYSHKSIANTVWVPMVANDQSQLFMKELAYDQLAFFIEMSTRFVKWGLDKMYKDPDVMASPHRDIFLRSLETSAQAYHNIAKEATAFYRSDIPFEKWQGWQNDETLRDPEKTQRIKYKRETKAAALDVARFLLPQACQGNVAWVLDARSSEFDVAAWKGHPLAEISGGADYIEKHAGQIAPSLLKYTKMNPYYADKLNGYDGDLRAESPQRFAKGVDLIYHDPVALDNSIAHILKRHNFGGTFSQRYGEAKRMSFGKKMDILRRVTENRGSHDEWIEMDEEFDLTKIAFEIRTDLGAIRDWRRHQKWDRSESLYSLDNGVHKPYMIEQMSPEVSQIFDDAMEVAHEAEVAIRRDLPYQAQLVDPMATMHSLTMSGGLDQLQYMAWTRSTPEGNFSYREDAFNIAEMAVETHPWLLGYEHYPEGKDFMTVYEEAPLKGLLRLQTGETALHQ
jgi:thymidylate synthase ThyX